MTFNWNDQNILITGGTGSFGRKFVEIMLKEYHPKRLVILSRDELKQHEMQVGGFNDRSLRYFIGDVRDSRRLDRAFKGIDIVVHAAALKTSTCLRVQPRLKPSPPTSTARGTSLTQPSTTGSSECSR